VPTTDLPADLVELARVLVGLPWFKWRSGMRMVSPSGANFRAVFERGGLRFVMESRGRDGFFGGEDLPDLYDPATLGCLIALVSELAWGPVSIRWVPHLVGGVWYAETAGALQARGPTEAHALIALALQVTP